MALRQIFEWKWPGWRYIMPTLRWKGKKEEEKEQDGPVRERRSESGLYKVKCACACLVEWAGRLTLPKLLHDNSRGIYRSTRSSSATVGSRGQCTVGHGAAGS